MVDKQFFESFLRVNKLNTGVSAAQIESMLNAARWTPQDIKEALLIYSGKDPSAGASTEKSENRLLFRPDMEWSSSKLSSLLGMDVVIDPKSFRMPSSTETRRNIGKKIVIGLCIAIAAVTIAGGIGAGLMYLFEIGPFYTQAESII